MITSTGNAQVKHLLQLRQKRKVRDQGGVFIVEGNKMFEEAPPDDIQKVYVSETFYNKKKNNISLKGYKVQVLSDSLFAHVSDTKTPQGILCVVKQRRYGLQEILTRKNPHIIVLDTLQDPGNVGTIVRTAEGAGVTGIIMSKACVDMYNPKTIRSTMGSIYRMPFIMWRSWRIYFMILKREISPHMRHI